MSGIIRESMSPIRNVVLASILLATAGANAASPCQRAYRTAEPLFTSRGISSAAYGDFDEDGRVDVALMTDYDTRWVALNRDGHVFEPLTPEVSTHNSSLQLAGTADVNHDGHLDLLYRATGVAGVAFGRGDGTFGALISTQLPIIPDVPARTIDFNQDGVPDFISAYGNTFTFIQAKGDGTFAEVTHESLSNGSYQEVTLTAGDFDGDGDIDVARIATELPSFRTVATFGWNDGHLGFVETSETIDVPHTLRPVDLDGNGAEALAAIDDGSLVVARVKNHHLAVERFPVAGNGVSMTFVTPVMRDVDGDGLPDLVFSAAVSSLGVVFRKADGGFRDATFYNLPGMTGYSLGIAAVDLDGDGLADFAARGGFDELAVLHGGALRLGNGDANRVYRPGFSPRMVVLADVDGDGLSDLVAYGSSVDGTFQARAFFGDGHGDFRRTTSLLAMKSYDQGFVGDFDGDGRADLAVSPAAAGSVTPVLTFGGTGGFEQSLTLGVDLVVGSLFTSSTAPAALIGLKGDDVELITISSGRTVTMTPIYHRAAGARVIAVRTPPGKPAQIGVSTNSGMRLVTQGATAWQEGALIPLFAVQSIEAVDLNADGFPDLIVRDANNSPKVFYASGDGSFGVPYGVTGSPGFVDSVTPRDIDGDGQLDLVVTSRLSFGDPGILQVMRNAGGSVFEANSSALTGAPFGQIPAVGDVDGDGQPEVLLPVFDGVEVLANVCATPRLRVAVVPRNPAPGSTARLIVHALPTESFVGPVTILQGEKTLTMQQPGSGSFVWSTPPLAAGLNTFRVTYRDQYGGSSEMTVTINAALPVPHRRAATH